jgi:hypothetical protein
MFESLIAGPPSAYDTLSYRARCAVGVGGPWLKPFDVAKACAALYSNLI